MLTGGALTLIVLFGEQCWCAGNLHEQIRVAENGQPLPKNVVSRLCNRDRGEVLVYLPLEVRRQSELPQRLSLAQ